MIIIKLNEDYLDDNEEFYDYRTKPFDGHNPFDINRGESAFVQNLIKDPDYMSEYKNLKSEIVYMTPKEYFEGCAKIFNSSSTTQINQTRRDKKVLDKLQQVLMKYKRTFPVTYLNYAQNGQEGRHRMFVVGELLGWDKKFPVLVITWANAELANAEKAAEEQKRKEAILYNIEMAIDFVKDLGCIDEEDFINELKRTLTRKFDEDEIDVQSDDTDLHVKVKDVKKSVKLSTLNIDNIMDLDIEDLL